MILQRLHRSGDDIAMQLGDFGILIQDPSQFRVRLQAGLPFLAAVTSARGSWSPFRLGLQDIAPEKVLDVRRSTTQVEGQSSARPFPSRLAVRHCVHDSRIKEEGESAFQDLPPDVLGERFDKYPAAICSNASGWILRLFG